MTMRDMTGEEMRVSQAMSEGNLEPLADLLKRESPDVHPLIQRKLFQLIRGSEEEVDFRLTTVAKYKDKRNSIKAQNERTAEGLRIAQVMVRHGALDGAWESAVLATMEELSIKRTKVTTHWSEQKGFMKFMQGARARAEKLGIVWAE